MKMREDDRLINPMTSRMEKILAPLLDSGGVLGGKKIETLRFVRVREGRFIWEVQLSSLLLPPEHVFVKAIPPHKKNIPEIILYKKKPPSLQTFFPTIYQVSKKYGFYWLVMEELKPLPIPQLCKSGFANLLQLVAVLHAKHYSKDGILTNGEMSWVPHFQREWNKRMNKLWLILQLRKYMRRPKTSEILAKDQSFLKKIISISPTTLRSLLSFPHTVIHGCLTPHHFLTSSDNSQLKLIDWAMLCFAPFTVDLVDLIERGIREYAQEESQASQFRENCLSSYCEYLNRQGCNVNRHDLERWYEITLLFKIVGELIWKELKKINIGEPSKYYWYRDRLSNLLNFSLRK